MSKNNLRLLISLCLIHFLLGFDINIVSVSLPSAADFFKVSPGIVSRVNWIYFLVIVCLLIASGRIGDLKGFKKIYTGGIAVFILGSVMSALSGDFDFLIVSRIVQAIGAAVLFSLTPAIITFYFPEEIRGKVFGINYSCTALGGIAGRVASGFLISEFGWNSVFWLNIPFGLIALILIYKYLPDYIHSGKKGKFDLLSALMISSGLFFLMIVLNNGKLWGWTSSAVIISLILSALLIAVFIFYQKKSPDPLLEINMLKEKRISFSVAAFALVYLITNGMIYIVPFYLQWIKLISKQEAGLMMAIPSVMQLISGYFSGKLSDEKSKIKICSAAIVLIIISLSLHLMFSDNTGYYFIIFALAMYGFSIGFFIPANTNNIMTNAPVERKGSVSGFMTTSIRLGSAFGTVIFGSIFSAYVPTADPLKSGFPVEVMISGFRAAVAAGIFSAAVALVLIQFQKNQKSV